MAEHSHPVVSREEWLEARKRLLVKEKEYTRLGDRLSEERRQLPWERVEKEYIFDGPAGKESLADLFAGNSQLAVYHSCSVLTGRRAAHIAHSGLTTSTVSTFI